MTFGSLFSGIGGLDLGLEWTGMKCKWQVEIDDYCRKVLTKHWPDVRKYEDVRKVGKHNLESVELICGGFPCQPWSLAGKRRGVEDDRHLWPEMLRVIRELRPRFVLGENVPGIAPYLDTVVDDLERESYQAFTIEVPAAAFDAPHLRYRIYLIANDTSEQMGIARQSRLNGGVVPDNDGDRFRKWPGESESFGGCRDSSYSGKINETLADAECLREPQSRRRICDEWRRFSNGGENVADDGEQQRDGRPQWSSWWEREPLEVVQDARSGGRKETWQSIPESLLGRVANGVPHRVDRLRGLGNAVVPQVAEWIGRRILEVSCPANS